MDNNILIMVVEDDEILANEIKAFLRKWGYKAESAMNFLDIVADFSRLHPHLILLDINLPYYDGFYWCTKIREMSDIPIIYISSRGDDSDKIRAIVQGGDDYVEKPFNLHVLKAKMEAIIRRTYQYKVKDKIYLDPDTCFDTQTAILYYQNQEVDLTKSEKKILTKMFSCKGEIVSREELMMALWNTEEYVTDGTLTTMISRLRSKLEACCYNEIIKTKKGYGYYIE